MVDWSLGVVIYHEIVFAFLRSVLIDKQHEAHFFSTGVNGCFIKTPKLMSYEGDKHLM